MADKWVQLFPAAKPFPINGIGDFGLGSDENLNEIVFFGGYDGAPRDETWRWPYGGSTWIQDSPATPPTATSDVSLAYLPSTQEILLFNGGTSALAETWLRDSTRQWSNPSPATSPTARNGYGIASDVVNDRAIMFGGQVGASYLDETWAYDPGGVNWANLAPTTKPTPRRRPAMGYDPIREQVVLFGGEDVGEAFDDTWVFDVTDEWTELFPVDHPIGGVGVVDEFPVSPNMAWDPVRERLVMVTILFSASPRILRGWLWDGMNWELIETCTADVPSGRTGTGIAQDLTAGVGILFGGRNPVLTNTTYNDTWEFPVSCDVPPPTPPTQYQRIFGWRASIDDNALETIEVLTSPQTGSSG